jgi:hypothetical protein
MNDDKYKMYRIELIVNTQLVTKVTQDLIDKLVKQLGVEIKVKAAVLSNPDAIMMSAEVFEGGDCKPFDLTPDEHTFALKRLPTG